MGLTRSKSPNSKRNLFTNDSKFFHEKKYDEFLDGVYLKQIKKREELSNISSGKRIPTAYFSDNTIITGTTTWGEIKGSAMKPNYLDQTFCSYLLPHEKETLKRCMAA